MFVLDLDFANDDIVSIIMMRNDPNFKYISLNDGVLKIKQSLILLRYLIYFIDRPDIKIVITPCRIINQNNFPKQIQDRLFEFNLKVLSKIKVPKDFELTIIKSLPHLIYNKKLDIISLGSLSNIDAINNYFIKKQIKLKRKINLFISGGNIFRPGNVFKIVNNEIIYTDNVEWNIYFNILASKNVIEDDYCFFCKKIFPLDTTTWIKLTEFIDILSKDNTLIKNKYIKLILELFNGYFVSGDAIDDIYLFDEMVILYYYYPKLFSYELITSLKVSKEGQTLLYYDECKTSNSFVIMNPNKNKSIENIIKLILKGKPF